MRLKGRRFVIVLIKALKPPRKNILKLLLVGGLLRNDAVVCQKKRILYHTQRLNSDLLWIFSCWMDQMYKNYWNPIYFNDVNENAQKFHSVYWGANDMPDKTTDAMCNGVIVNTIEKCIWMNLIYPDNKNLQKCRKCFQIHSEHLIY